MSHEKYYLNMDRLDILCGNPIRMPIFPCEKCYKDNCDGENECKGYGSYVLGVKIK
jgi:hypothetical protein